jgi:hypothetical protein
MPRMKILNSVEREAFELPPVFNSVERKRNFDFPVAIEQIAQSTLFPGQLRLLQSDPSILSCPRLPPARYQLRG